MSTTRTTVADLARLVEAQQAQIAALTEALQAQVKATAPTPAARPARHDANAKTGAPNPGVVRRADRSQGHFLYAIDGEIALVEGVRNKADTRTYVVRHILLTGKGGRQYVGTEYLQELEYATVERDGTRLQPTSVEQAKAVVLSGRPLPDPKARKAAAPKPRKSA